MQKRFEKKNKRTNMKKTFTIKLDTEFSIDFNTWGLSDAEQKGGQETKKLIINEYLEHCGVDEFRVSVGTGSDLSLQRPHHNLSLPQKNNGSLFAAMAAVVKAQNEDAMVHKIEN